jgi:N utilization substance protein A
MKGTRVQSIIRELRGEKIDIIEWAHDVNTLITNALSPARIQSLSVVDEAEKVVEVIVEDKQLSLAIGKKGQNVRLAAKLTGWKIDIKSEEDVRREVDAKFELAATLATVDGFTDAMWETLSTSELNSVDRLRESSATDIANLLSTDEEMATALQNAAHVAAETKAKLEQEAAEEAAKQAAAEAAIEEAAKQAAAEAAMEETPEQSAEEETDGTTDQLTEKEPSIDEKAADESATEQA